MEARLPSHPILAILAILRQTTHPIQTILRHTMLRHTILAIHTTILQTKWRPMRPSHYPYQTGRRRAKQPLTPQAKTRQDRLDSNEAK